MFMKNTFVLIFLAFSTVTFGQWGNTINLSSNITKETRDVTDFTKISATDDFVVYIKFSLASISTLSSVFDNFI